MSNLSKIRTLKGNKQFLLKEFNFKSINEAKMFLNETDNNRAYIRLLILYNETIDSIRNNAKLTKKLNTSDGVDVQTLRE